MNSEIKSYADKANILVVDDLPEKLLVFESILQELEQNIITARSGEEALKQVLEHEFAAILLDVNMPGLDGFETATLIRQRKKSAHTPIIFITAYADEMRTAQGYSLGAVDYILSPIVPEILRTKVGVFVELFQMNQQVKRQAEERIALAREQAARTAAEEATRRSTFLAEASRVLTSSLDLEATLRDLVRLVVPFLADLSAVTVVDEHGQIRKMELAWVDPSDQSGPCSSSGKGGFSTQLADAIKRVFANGKVEMLTDDLGPWHTNEAVADLTCVENCPLQGVTPLQGATPCRGATPLHPDFALRSTAILPLRARSRTLGVLVLALGPSGRRYGPVDLALAEDLAGHAAVAIERGLVEERLRESEKRFRFMADTAPVMIWTSGLDKLYDYFNKPWLEFTGRTLEQELGNGWVENVYPDDLERCLHTYVSAFDAHDEFRMEYRFRRADGEYRWILDNGTPRYNPTGEFLGYIGSCIDITERKRAEEALFEEKERAQITLAAIGDGVVTTDATGRVELLNLVAEQILGWTNPEAQGLSFARVFHILDEKTRKPMEDPVQKCLRLGQLVDFGNPVVLVRRDGQELSIDDSAAPLRDRAGKIVGAVVVFRDVTQQRQLVQQVSYQATHDALTGLINRREFERRMALMLQHAKEQHRQHALCYLDLDQFKVVNDTCGHVAGDELLRQLTAVLKTRLRERDTLGRLGGDEFGVLLGECPLDQALRIANHLRESIQDFRFVWQNKLFVLGVSIGLVPITEMSGDLLSILSAADSACYMAKESGGNRVHIYQAGDNELERRQSEMQWVTHLHKAMAEDRCRLYYQAIVPLSQGITGGTHGEILLRLLDDSEQIMLPGVFIPAAERYHQMLAIDRWVIRTALSALGARAPAYPLATYAINVSGQSLSNSELLSFVIEQLDQTGINPAQICFEITETTAIAHLGSAMKFISTLKERDCRFALDDFGSGLCSFAYLKNLPVDYLKIDGGFVKDMANDLIDCAMVEAINRVAHLMGIKTIAESVENEAIMDKLKAIGVDYAQGYGIARPRPLVEVIGASNSNSVSK